MAKDKKIKLETLSQTSKRKKDMLIILGIVSILALLGFSIFSFSLDVDKKKVYASRDNDSIKNSSLKITPKENIKEAWAISVENTFKEQNKVLLQFMKDVKETRKEDQKEILSMIDESQKDQESQLLDISGKVEKELKKLKLELKESILKQDNKLEEIKLSKGGSNISIINSNPEEDIILGDNLLPQIKEDAIKDRNLERIINGEDPLKPGEKDPKDTNLGLEDPFGGNTLKDPQDGGSIQDKPVVVEKKKVSLFEISTKGTKRYLLKEKQAELAAIKKRMKKKNTYHIMIGLTKAYLVTGVYAPAFSEGKSDPLPVLLQAEGDILIANNDTETIENCFFIGSAKGNMNTETADIRLNRISCSLANGTKKIEGSISGWVIGETGIPGVPGELLHKNGAWLAKTFVAGFLNTFSQSLVSYAGSGRNGSINGSNGGSVDFGSSAIESGAQSTSDVFNKIGDYYLEMAEQIFPVIEVKPGRTVDILLKGGESLTVTDFNSADIDAIENDIRALKAEKEADEERLQELKIDEINSKYGSKDVIATSNPSVRVKTKPIKARNSTPGDVDDLFN